MPAGARRIQALLRSASGRRGELGMWANRGLTRPRWELQRIWTYSTFSGRQAFLEFQRQYIQQQVPVLRQLRRAIGIRPLAQTSATCYGTGSNLPARPLGELLTSHGSDKASTHDYNKIYESIQREVDTPRLVFEVGIGTTAPRASSMGSDGQPGASARAFRDWGSRVIACDIDKATLFTEPGIETFYLDQLRPSTFKASLARAKALGGVDLAVVDGLHTPEADLNSLLALAPILSDVGVLVIEDIEPDPAILSLWRVLLANVPEIFSTVLLETRASWVALMAPTGIWNAGRLAALYRSGAGESKEALE